MSFVCASLSFRHTHIHTFNLMCTCSSNLTFPCLFVCMFVCVSVCIHVVHEVALSLTLISPIMKNKQVWRFGRLTAP